MHNRCTIVQISDLIRSVVKKSRTPNIFNNNIDFSKLNTVYVRCNICNLGSHCKKDMNRSSVHILWEDIKYSLVAATLVEEVKVLDEKAEEGHYDSLAFICSASATPHCGFQCAAITAEIAARVHLMLQYREFCRLYFWPLKAVKNVSVLQFRSNTNWSLI